MKKNIFFMKIIREESANINAEDVKQVEDGR